MNRMTFFLGMVGMIWIQATAQSALYQPIEFRRAYERGTRSADGSVPPGYWQNTAAYRIKASVDPYAKTISGTADITYVNHSPDTLRSIVFHTYADLYRQGAVRDRFRRDITPETFNAGFVLDKLVVGDKDWDLNDRRTLRSRGTQYVITLDHPLSPGASLDLSITWNEPIPGKGFERAGAIDSTSMFVAYWYPEIAVYDDIDGWDEVIYDGSAEFYHDINDYLVELEVPSNFMVWASVAPDNPKEVYAARIRERLDKAAESREPVVIYGPEDFQTNPSRKTTTWKYRATQFRDFSFALSDHFIWEAAVHRDDMGEYRINTAYPPDHKAFSSVIGTISGSLELFHTKFPVYPFPFRYFTIFNGLIGGGMEFAGMANDGVSSGEQASRRTGKTVSDYDANFGLSLHEMCHMYFPFLLGINEKKYAWMDEGMASVAGYFEKEAIYAYDRDNAFLAEQSVCPPMVPTYTQPRVSGINSYTVGSRSYQSLSELLGRDLFLKCMQAYMDTWKNKHPTPYDFMHIFNRTSGQDLNWFWKKWYFDWGYPDLSIRSFSAGNLVVENSGGKPIHSRIEYIFDNGETQLEDIPVSAWRDSDTVTLRVESFQLIKEIRLSSAMGGDVISSNNIWRRE